MLCALTAQAVFPGMQKELTILIVDDNPGIRRLLRRSLAGSATKIWECSDGAMALPAYQEYRPDLVLMDIRMPEVDGLTATQNIRRYDPSARVIVVTDYEDDDLRAVALQAGAMDYILKQNISELPALISTLNR